MFGDEEDDQVDETIFTRPQACGVLQFHNGTEEAMFLYVKQHSEEGDVNNIIKAIDEFCYKRHWMMHLGKCCQSYSFSFRLICLCMLLVSYR